MALKADFSRVVRVTTIDLVEDFAWYGFGYGWFFGNPKHDIPQNGDYPYRFARDGFGHSYVEGPWSIENEIRKSLMGRYLSRLSIDTRVGLVARYVVNNWSGSSKRGIYINLAPSVALGVVVEAADMKDAV